MPCRIYYDILLNSKPNSHMLKRDVVKREELYEFQALAVSRMSRSALAQSKGLGTDRRPYERLFQVAFYAAAASCCGFQATISPDVGAVNFCLVSFLKGAEILHGGN